MKGDSQRKNQDQEDQNTDYRQDPSLTRHRQHQGKCDNKQHHMSIDNKRNIPSESNIGFNTSTTATASLPQLSTECLQHGEMLA
ncbi:hypothetical protein ACTUVK_001528 [Stenotrophomonas rhizophila]